ncbi:kinase-like protein [Basidiobolus meristosporus CBS 931.73]|uniref:non-specific serine/threonine protein kinase n=1 Tax=Basidiobolus meristosporus CBS 931.73 TaxID=1314790 RepID=A0A1Y1YLQ0_9FUNG|nr:kinase-like protein [Basidiobolus meristosporus CBS 931.73]|eukprot:ORX98514.1 kinase-like protein [Basidiobolus meristosporus CBS 931.73]
MSVESRYSFLHILGMGSFGVVWAARRNNDRKIFAIKLITVKSNEQTKLHYFLNEARVLRGVKHPNLVFIEEYTHDVPKERLYIVMEYCGHRDLAFFIKEFRANSCLVRPAKVWAIFAQVVNAVHWCHLQPRMIVHRDIKPENVFITANNTFKLGDFGLYRSLAQRSVAYSFVGTPLYMAPEMLRNQPYSSKVDIWALGLLLYELCCLKPLFQANNQEELLKQMMLQPPPNIPLIYPQSMQRLLHSMLNLEVSWIGKHNTIHNILNFASLYRDRLFRR